MGFGDWGGGLRGGGRVSVASLLAPWSMPYGCVLDLLKDDDDMTKVHLQRRLGFKESFAIVVGSIIGTGVFLKTAVMAQDAGPPLYVLLAWLVAGVLSVMGALTYAELSCLLDRKSTRLNSSHQIISYAVFCLQKKNEWDY